MLPTAYYLSAATPNKTESLPISAYRHYIQLGMAWNAVALAEMNLIKIEFLPVFTETVCHIAIAYRPLVKK